jgi:hypothetical protein
MEFLKRTLRLNVKIDESMQKYKLWRKYLWLLC